MNAALAELQQFLDAWRDDGQYAAAKRYLVASERVTTKDAPLVLLDGRVTSAALRSWVSVNRFTLLVDVNLRFRGDTGAFGPGRNTRFVAFTRPSRRAPYRLFFSTSP